MPIWRRWSIGFWIAGETHSGYATHSAKPRANRIRCQSHVFSKPTRPSRKFHRQDATFGKEDRRSWIVDEEARRYPITNNKLPHSLGLGLTNDDF